ncbi:MAG: hypothetical protein IKK53_07460 [Ruminiclostridium sp.]|nr:hypothetical protein [Ruminiclostridium sp.]
MKLSSALKKEFMYFSRTFRLMGVVLAIISFAVFDPVLFKGMEFVMEELVIVAEEQNEAAIAAGSEDDAVFTESDIEVLESFSDIDAPYMLATGVADLTGSAVLIILFIMMGPSGSEQKKRSIIIPRCAGLTPGMYVTPKFIIYPLTGFITGFAAMFVCAGVTSLLFEGAIDMSMVALAAASVGLYIAFAMMLELTLGICTEKPGVSVITVLAATSIIPILLSSFRIDKFNPFALPSIAQSAFLKDTTAMGIQTNVTLNMTNVAVSLLVTVILSLILYFTTLFVLTARQIENEGNEAIL